MATVTRHAAPAALLSPEPHLQALLWGLCCIVVIYIVGMWCCWGTLNFRTVARHHRERQAVDAAYDEVYLRKETLLYHLDWARQRGDRAEVQTLEAQMAGIDKELDEVEAKLRALDSSAQRSSKSSSKHA
jgi:hypothetical protein